MVDFLLVYYSGIFCTWPTTGSLYIYIYTQQYGGPLPLLSWSEWWALLPNSRVFLLAAFCKPVRSLCLAFLSLLPSALPREDGQQHLTC